MLLHDRLLLHFCIHWDYLRLFSLTVLSQLITRVLPFFFSLYLPICTTSSFNRFSSVLSTGSFTDTSTELFVDVLRLFTNLSFFLNCGKPVFLVDTLHQESYTSSPSPINIQLVLSRALGGVSTPSIRVFRMLSFHPTITNSHI